MKLFGDGCAADYLSAFKNQWRKACFRQVICRYETIVPGPDDDDVALFRH
jgi:hypothetical protein